MTSGSRLVSLTLDNFKSYRGHQEIGPFSNFTAIIGPNGAGKSNVMDAISFVLGVSASHLRSSSGKDLIYRQETGKPFANKASVSAVLETGIAGEQLVFKRTINLSGSSEYRVNDKTVPFAQYVKVLETQNILVKARNFLVFQGDVEAVANKNPKDLTKLFEQISGSEEFKDEYDRLKDLADKAAEASQFEFHKKKGISAEMKQFQEQKEEALKFEKLQNEKDSLILKHLLWRLYHMEQNTNALDMEITQDDRKMKEIGEETRKLEKDLKAAKKDIASSQKELLQAEQNVKQLIKEKETMIPEKLKLKEQLSFKKRKIEKVSSQLQESEQELEAKLSLVSKKENEAKQVSAELDEFNVMASSTQQHVSTLTDSERRQYFELKQKLSGEVMFEKTQLEQLNQDRSLEVEGIRRFNEQKNQLESKIESLVTEEKLVNGKKDRIASVVDKTETELQDIEQMLQSNLQTRNILSVQEQETNTRLNEVSNLLSEFKTDRRMSEKESRLNEAISSMKRIFPGVHGRLSDLCKPINKKYDIAVSIILGKNMDSVVVDNSKTAINCISYMREQRAGTLTFLPLDSISVKPIQEKFRGLVKGARLAVDVIKCEGAFEKAVHYACSSSLICDTLDIAKFVCYEKRCSVKAVSMDGNVIHKSGFMTGGTMPGSSQRNKFEEKDVEAWIATRDALETKLMEIGKEKKNIGSDEPLKAKLIELQSRLSFAKEDLEITGRKLESLAKERSVFESNALSLAPIIQEAQDKLSGIDEKIRVKETKVFSAEDKVFREFCASIGVANIREYEELQVKRAQEISQKKMELTSNHAKLQSDLEFEQQQLSFIQEKVKQTRLDMEEENTAIEKVEEAMKQVKAKIEALEESLSQAMLKQKEIWKEMDQRESVVQSVKRQLNKSSGTYDQLSKGLGSRQALYERMVQERWAIFRKCRMENIDLPVYKEEDPNAMQVDGKEHSGAAKSVLMEEENDSVLLVDYRLLDSESRKNDTETMEMWFQDKIRQISSDIERMAPNMKAIERLEKVEDQFKTSADSFDTARKEAKAARDQFKRVKDQRYHTFMRAFKIVSSRIDSVYKELTKSRNIPVGGTAYLSLENNEEPYLDGIKYSAMPPMKRFRDMEQLSGGEKTVAALALLFAIHSYRPSPFFVLDEVDAALDNANVSRIARYLVQTSREDEARDRENSLSNSNQTTLSSETGSNLSVKRGRFGPQLIVISLKSSLYDKADALVGVYRDQEEKSSRMLTLDLTAYEEIGK